jgi:predicted RNase H-like HicB family nuclease
MTTEAFATNTSGMLRQAIIYPGEDGYWVAECPSLPGCISQGESRAEAIINIREAIHAYVDALEADRLSVPPRQ